MFILSMLKEHIPASSAKQPDLTDFSALNYFLGIYGVPYSAGSVLKIEPATGRCFGVIGELQDGIWWKRDRTSEKSLASPDR